MFLSVFDVDYFFRPDETIKQSLIRITTELAVDAIGTWDNDQDVVSAVHHTRVACKRINAVLVLLEPCELTKSIEKKAHHVSHLLARVRDATVVYDSVAALEGAWTLRATLEQLDWRRKKRYVELFNDGCIDRVLKLLNEVTELAQDLRVKNRVSHITPGMLHTYKQARRLQPKSAKSGLHKPNKLHRFRQFTKQHGYHTQLLSSLAPKTIGLRLEALNELGQQLGDVRDLSFAAQHICQNKYQKIVYRKQRKLLKSTLATSSELFSQPPDRFAKQLSHQWQKWRERSST